MQTSRENQLDEEELGKLVADLLMAGRPRAVLNINSRAGWLAYRNHGKQLSRYMRLMATQFCRDFHDYGGFGGYGDEFLRDTIDSLDLVMLDNATFKQDLVDSLGLLERDAAKMHVAYQPCNLAVRDLPMESRSTGNVLWLGRIHPQKRPDLLAEVAGLMPERTFHVYGGPIDGETIDRFRLRKPNVVLHGPIQDVGMLDPLDFGALLFTSAYEGLPNVPIEVGSMGLPIVASSAGGLRELIDERTGWLLDLAATPVEYVAALTEALEPVRGALRGAALQKRVAKRHTLDQLQRRLTDSGLFT